MNVENLTAVCALCSSHSNTLSHTSQLALGGSRLPGVLASSLEWTPFASSVSEATLALFNA